MTNRCEHLNVKCIYEGEPYFDGNISEVSFTEPIYECEDCSETVLLEHGKFFTKAELKEYNKAWLGKNEKRLEKLCEDIPF